MLKNRRFHLYSFEKKYDKSITIFVSKCCHSTVKELIYTSCICRECGSSFTSDYTVEMFVWNQHTPPGIYRKNKYILNLDFLN